MRVCGRIWEFRVRCLLTHSALCPLPTGPQVEKVPPAPCQQSQGREFCQAVWCDSQPLCHFSETSPPLASGENKADSQALRGGREGAQCIQGSGNPQISPHGAGGVCEWLTGQRAATRACGGPWRQVSRFPLSPHSPAHINIYLGKAKVI